MGEADETGIISRVGPSFENKDEASVMREGIMGDTIDKVLEYMQDVRADESGGSSKSREGQCQCVGECDRCNADD